MSNADELVVAALRGEPLPWPWHQGELMGAEFLARSRRHRVQALLYHKLRSGRHWPHWPRSVRDGLRSDAIIQATIEAYRQSNVREALTALAEAGIPSLLMKGTALAYTIYPLPSLRPCHDTDLLVRDGDWKRVAELLRGVGYVQGIAIPGQLVSHQRMFARRNGPRSSHVLDVHRRILNAQSYASLLTFDALARSSIPVPALGPSARAPGTIHAMLLACLHRFAHHPEDDRLIWLYDVHLLGQAMTQKDWAQALRLARELGIAAICGQAIGAAAGRLGTVVPTEIAQGFEQSARSTQIPLLERRWQQLLADLRALPDWRRRLRLLAEHALPPAQYMRNRYGCTHSCLLPWYYARRLVFGLCKLTRRVPRLARSGHTGR